MEIEYKNKDCGIKDIFQVGNVIEHDDFVYLVASYAGPGEYAKYFLVDLKHATLGSEMYKSLDELAKIFIDIWSRGKAEIRLVKAKLIVDYKLVGDE